MIVLEAVFAQFLLHFDLLHCFSQKGKLSAVEILLAFVSYVGRLLLEQSCEFVGLLLCFLVVLLQRGAERGYFLAHLQQLLLAARQMGFGEGLQNVRPHQMHEISDLRASRCILIVEGIEDDAAVDVYVPAERVVLQRIPRIHHWRVDVFLLLLCLFLEEGLIIFEVLQRPFNPEVDLVLEELNHPSV